MHVCVEARGQSSAFYLRSIFSTWALGIEFLMFAANTSLTQLFPQAPDYCFDYFPFRESEFLF